MAVPRRTLILLRRLANQVGQEADDTVRALTASWVAAWDQLSPAWQQGISALVDEYRKTGRWPAPWQVARIEAVARAQEHTERALTVLAVEASTVTKAAAGRVSEATLHGEPGVIASQLHGKHKVAVPVVQAARALNARRNRIGVLHAPLPSSAMSAVRQSFNRPPAATDPAQIGRDLYSRTRSGFESALTRSATIARTELPDTYRTAAGLVHTANEQLITGWAWVSALDRSCCVACWVMHGTVFDGIQTPGPWGHPGCRCTRLAIIKGQGPKGLPDAQRRFSQLSRNRQLEILGPGRLSLLRAGVVKWGDLAVQRDNRNWRPSFVPRPVADLRAKAGMRTLGTQPN